MRCLQALGSTLRLPRAPLKIGIHQVGEGELAEPLSAE
jgi:hypothetical protein